jgi:hypothetical protein
VTQGLAKLRSSVGESISSGKGRTQQSSGPCPTRDTGRLSGLDYWMAQTTESSSKEKLSDTCT